MKKNIAIYEYTLPTSSLFSLGKLVCYSVPVVAFYATPCLSPLNFVATWRHVLGMEKRLPFNHLQCIWRVSE